MRVLHVAHGLSTRLGGPQTMLLDLVRAQSAAGLIVDVVASNLDFPSGVLNVPTDQRVELDGIGFYYFSVQYRPLAISFGLRAFLDRRVAEYDVVHIHGLYRFPTTYAARAARRQRVPYIIRPHGSLDPYLYQRSSRSLLAKRAYERLFDIPNLNAASALHFTAEQERERASFLGIRAPSFVVPNGVRWERFERLPSKGNFRATYRIGEVPLLLFLGRINFKKGLDILIPALDKIRQTIPNAELAIVGPDNDGYGQQVRTWVAERGLTSVVHFIGHLEGASVLSAYVDADVFVLPSYTENFGMSVVEAMACGAPVVISDQVNIHDEISSADAGVVTRCDVRDVASAVIALLRSPADRQSLGARARSFVKENYSWSVIVGQLTAQYERIAARAAA